MGDFDWREVGERIRLRRLAAGMTQSDLAAAAGLTQPAVFRLEAGDTNPQLETLRRLALALRSSVRELVAGTQASDPRLLQAGRILGSGDPAAVRVLENALFAAEAVLSRRGRKLRELTAEEQAKYRPLLDPVGTPVQDRKLTFGGPGASLVSERRARRRGGTEKAKGAARPPKRP